MRPTLGDFIWEYLISNECVYYTPTICTFGVIVISAIIHWMLITHMVAIPNDEKLLFQVLSTNIISKYIAMEIFLLVIWEEITFIDPLYAIIGLIILTFIFESILYYRKLSAPSTQDLLCFVLVAHIGCIAATWLITSFGFLCIAAFITGIVVGIKLINQDKLVVMELGWILFLVLFFGHFL